MAELERNINISNGQIRKWDSVSPKTSNLVSVAKYFNVSLDFLTGLSLEDETPKRLTNFESYLLEKGNRDLKIKKLNELLNDFDSSQVEEIIRFVQYLKSQSEQSK